MKGISTAQEMKLSVTSMVHGQTFLKGFKVYEK